MSFYFIRLTKGLKNRSSAGWDYRQKAPRTLVIVMKFMTYLDDSIKKTYSSSLLWPSNWALGIYSKEIIRDADEDLLNVGVLDRMLSWNDFKYANQTGILALICKEFICNRFPMIKIIKHNCVLMTFTVDINLWFLFINRHLNIYSHRFYILTRLLFLL